MTRWRGLGLGLALLVVLVVLVVAAVRIEARDAVDPDVFDIGDREFPLSVRPGDVDRSAPEVGSWAYVGDLARGVLSPLRGRKGRVTGVIRKNGRIAGYEVMLREKDGGADHGRRRYLAPAKDFFLEDQMQIVEDAYLASTYAQLVRRALAPWATQRDYYGPAWDGVEKINYALAAVAPAAAVEAAGWYRYPSSRAGEAGRQRMDGKDWRLVLANPGRVDPNNKEYVVVNFHSLLHDAVWTVTTTVYDDEAINPARLDWAADRDPWIRALLWTLGVAEALETHGYNYAPAKAGLRRRLSDSRWLRGVLEKVTLPRARAAFRKVYGREPVLPEYITVVCAAWNLRPGTAGSYQAPHVSRGIRIPWGTITVDPAALQRGGTTPKTRKAQCDRTEEGYAACVLLHEAIHALFAEECVPGNHGAEFQRMAAALGLPPEYRD